jgi:F-type H+-transporting ATPase subunit gamma
MATEKQIWNQIQSTKNIQKITSSMKMVSAAKLKGDEGRRMTAISFNNWADALNGPPQAVEDATFEELPQRSLIVTLQSDKGLCGGINSFITKSVKNCVTSLQKQGKEADIAVIGDKGRGQLRRVYPELIQVSMTEVMSPGNFTWRVPLPVSSLPLELVIMMPLFSCTTSSRMLPLTPKCTRLSSLSVERERTSHSSPTNSSLIPSQKS